MRAQSAGTFTATGSMITPRMLHTATLLLDGSDGADYTSAELYDPDTGTFSPVAFTNSGGLVAATANLLTNGRVLFTLQVAECNFSSPTANSYEPSTGMFIAAPAMVYPHCQSVSARLTDGSVLSMTGRRRNTGLPQPVGKPRSGISVSD